MVWLKHDMGRRVKGQKMPYGAGLHDQGYTALHRWQVLFFLDRVLLCILNGCERGEPPVPACPVLGLGYVPPPLAALSLVLSLRATVTGHCLTPDQLHDFFVPQFLCLQNRRIYSMVGTIIPESEVSREK